MSAPHKLAVQTHPSRRRLLGDLAAIGLAGMLAARHAAAASEVTVGMIPDAGATQVSIEQKAPLRDYLARAIGAPVKLVIPTSYNATVEGLGNGSLDFAYLGGLTYVKAHARYGVIPLVQRKIDQQFHSYFITQANSSIRTLADLKGKNFAFGDINSTSGHLMAYRAMKQAGIDPDHDLKWFRYTGSHAATVQAVAAGIADAGSCDGTVLQGLIASGKIDAKAVRVFFVSPSFVDYVWVARKDIAPALRDKFAQAFLSLTSAHDAALLGILRGRSFVRANDAEYDPVREVARAFHMI